jgi:F0F1-type ATP synthase assembly protein I
MASDHVVGRVAAPAAGDDGHTHEDPRDRPIAELVKDLASQTSTLVRQEIALAQAEVTQKAKIAGAGAAMLGGAAIAALLMLGALTATLIIVLDEWMPTWLAALIVTLLWGVVAAVLAKAGQARIKRATPPVPQTMETVKEDIEWAKHPSRSAQR